MRPTLSWPDLQGRHIGLYGLGREGIANLRACRDLGVSPVLVDDRPTAPLFEGQPVHRTSDDGLDQLLACDVVVKAPGVFRYADPVRRLKAGGVVVTGGLGLWLQGADRSRVVCITGTKGKSTTTAIAGHLLERLGHRCLVGGNIGVPPWDPELRGDYDSWVIEVSSYQATDLGASPPVTAVTSLSPDHLPWHHDDSETYYRDKLSMCRLPGADLTVANGDSELIRARRDLLGPRVQWIHNDDEDGEWTEALGVLGAHNHRNALIAAACLRGLGVPGAAGTDLLTEAAKGFPGLASRLTPIGDVGGVLFVDDGLSTNVLPTIAAVEAFPARRVAVIVGGMSRGIDYAPLAVGLRGRKRDTLMVTVPSNGPEIKRIVDAAGAGPRVETVDRPSLGAAVTAAYEWARPDGVVLLSPAAASFDLFRDYQERSAVFAAAMHGLIA